MRASETREEKGFTLVEVSVVLVIIGLIVGAAFVGKDLIRSSELQSVMTEAQKYSSAVGAFALQYNALPGDMTKATDYWGTNPNCATNQPGTGTQTCNGNGNNMIEVNTTGVYHGESFYFWQHLGNAGLVPGSFSGQITGSGGTSIAAGVDAPESRYNQNVWVPFNFSYADHGFPTPGVDRKNRFYLGRDMSNPLGWVAGVRCNDLKMLDKKYDDGMPYTGKIQAFDGGGCTTSATSLAATYLTSSDGVFAFLRYPIMGQ